MFNRAPGNLVTSLIASATLFACTSESVELYSEEDLALPTANLTVGQQAARIARVELGNSARNHEVNGCNFYAGNFYAGDVYGGAVYAGAVYGGAVYGGPRGCPQGWASAEWCADFAKYVWSSAGGIADLGQIDSLAQSFKDYGIAHGTWHPIESGYQPQPGDAIVYRDGPDADSRADHVGIVYSSSNGQLVTIEGNLGDGVDRITEVTRHSGVQGYASPAPPR